MNNKNIQPRDEVCDSLPRRSQNQFSFAATDPVYELCRMVARQLAERNGDKESLLELLGLMLQCFKALLAADQEPIAMRLAALDELRMSAPDVAIAFARSWCGTGLNLEALRLGLSGNNLMLVCSLLRMVYVVDLHVHTIDQQALLDLALEHWMLGRDLLARANFGNVGLPPMLQMVSRAMKTEPTADKLRLLAEARRSDAVYREVIDKLRAQVAGPAGRSKPRAALPGSSSRSPRKVVRLVSNATAAEGGDSGAIPASPLAWLPSPGMSDMTQTVLSMVVHRLAARAGDGEED